MISNFKRTHYRQLASSPDFVTAKFGLTFNLADSPGISLQSGGGLLRREIAPKIDVNVTQSHRNIDGLTKFWLSV